MRDRTEIVGQLLLSRYSYYWDGGSILLGGKDDEANEVEIVLGQRKFLLKSHGSWTPGRLFINDILVEQRSKLEDSILNKLKSVRIEAEVIHPPKWMQMKDGMRKKIIKFVSKTPATYGNAAISGWVQEVVEFIESEEYLLLPNKLKWRRNNP